MVSPLRTAALLTAAVMSSSATSAMPSLAELSVAHAVASSSSAAMGAASSAAARSGSGASSRLVTAYRRYKNKLNKQRKKAKRAIKYAKRQIGKPYRYGATGPGAYDCSGLAQRSWTTAGVRIPRVTYAQFSAIKRKIRKQKNLMAGDLVFFRGKGHVGIYLRKGRYIHSPRTGERVQISTLRARRYSYVGAVRPAAPRFRRWPAAVRLAADV